MDYIAELSAIAKENGGIIQTKLAAQHGVSKAMLCKLCKADRIQERRIYPPVGLSSAGFAVVCFSISFPSCGLSVNVDLSKFDVPHYSTRFGSCQYFTQKNASNAHLPQTHKKTAAHAACLSRLPWSRMWVFTKFRFKERMTLFSIPC